MKAPLFIEVHSLFDLLEFWDFTEEKLAEIMCRVDEVDANVEITLLDEDKNCVSRIVHVDGCWRDCGCDKAYYVV